MGVIGSAVGGIVSAVGSLQQSQAEKQMSEYEAKQAENAAYLAEQAGAAAYGDIRAQTGAVLGTQAARIKAGGVTLEGTPLQVMADSAAAGELRAQRALYAGRVRQLGFQDIAALSKFRGYTAEREMFNRAGGSFLSSFGSSGGFQSLQSAYQGGGSGRSLLGG